jgi:hypothetical protein
VGHGSAVTAIERALVKLKQRGNTDPVDFLQQKLTAYAASDAGNAGKFTPHPATWFNAGRFDDDPAEWQEKKTENGAMKNYIPKLIPGG